MMIVFRLQ